MRELSMDTLGGELGQLLLQDLFQQLRG